MHLPQLIVDLALILAAASGAALLFRFLNQPIVLGYLIAGILVGPHIKFTPTVTETQGIQIWAELGVVFLLFVLGLEFSFRKLLSVGRVALVAASFEVTLMISIGFGLGRLLGWSSIDALFLGCILSISSTTIIIKAFDEQRIKTQSFASLVFGVLIIEDLWAVIILALLSTVAISRQLEGLPLLKEVGILVAFLGIIAPLGLWITPRLYRMIHSYLNDEVRVILALALCLGLVVLASTFGFSAALGAFLMGAFLGETLEGERAERFLKPIRDLFGAVFFVSIGMLVDVQQIVSNIPLILLISVVTMVGKKGLTALGARLGGEDGRTSLQAGLCLGQIGEFSFIMATLGLTLGVIRTELYSLAVSVAAVTTFATPYFIKLAQRLPHPKQKQSRRRPHDQPKLWDAHLVEFEIHPQFRHAGLTLQEIRIRENFGVSIVAINRGDRHIIAPTRDDRIMPFDRVVILGTDAQLEKLEAYLQSERHKETVEDIHFRLCKFQLSQSHELTGKSLRESGLRERVKGIILGIERNQKKMLNPDSTETLRDGDILWIYGDYAEIRSLISSNFEGSKLERF
jgi:Kef-type K+ transport system membrane component KefB/uncharacterized protein with PhoU and TrkA domain